MAAFPTVYDRVYQLVLILSEGADRKAELLARLKDDMCSNKSYHRKQHELVFKEWTQKEQCFLCTELFYPDFEERLCPTCCLKAKVEPFTPKLLS